MSYTRRTLVGILAGTVTSEVLQQPRASAMCSGNVRDLSGQGLQNWKVEMIEEDGTRQTETTQGVDGTYTFKRAPKAGPYMLVFKNTNAIAFHEVKRLTVRDAQTVSVTIDPNAKTFQSVYGELQALESLAAFATAFPAARAALTPDLKSIAAALQPLQRQIFDLNLPTGQMNFLKTKADNITVLARDLFVA